MPASGNALVTLTANIEDTANANTAYMGVSTNGVCPGTTGSGNLAATEEKSLGREHGTSSSTGAIQASATYELTGLSAGAHAFRACYKTTAAGGNKGVFQFRSIIVIPLP